LEPILTFKYHRIMEKHEDKIHYAFKPKDWNEIQTADSWKVFKIMSEFVEGFEKLARIGPCVAIFGSARTNPDSHYYRLTEEIALKLTQLGYGIISGGGPGIMEAANRGAQKGNGKSVGITIVLPFEHGGNQYIDRDKLISNDFFFVRKALFMKYSQGFIIMPGGFGTFDELFEALTLIQTEKIGRFPIVLVGKKFWKGLVDWIRQTMLEENRNINPEDMNLFRLVDTADEATTIIEEFYSKYLLSPNF